MNQPPCQFTLSSSSKADPLNKNDETTISMNPRNHAPCAVDIRLDGVLINGTPPVAKVGDFTIVGVSAESDITVKANKYGPSGTFIFKKTCPNTADSQGCGPTEMFYQFFPRAKAEKLEVSVYITIIGASAATGAVIGGFALGPLGAIGGAGAGAFAGCIIDFFIWLIF